jgi:uncharacterized protein (TIGR02246 family)
VPVTFLKIRNAPAPANVRALFSPRNKNFGDFALPCQNSLSLLTWLPLSCDGKRRIKEMKRFPIIFFLGFLAASTNTIAQTKADEEAVRKLPQAFCDAWAKHDGHELAKIMADDVDFVTVATTYLHGRADFEKFHARLLSGRFKESTLSPLQTTLRFLRPDMAVVHWSWKVEGDKNPDGTPRQPRYGLMTVVAEKRSGTWLVVVAQNTNAMLGIPPELQDIKTPIPIPGTDQKP